MFTSFIIESKEWSTFYNLSYETSSETISIFYFAKSAIFDCICLIIFCRKEGESLYDLLGVDKDATPEQIKKAYRKVG